jgi:biopolymer transport protein ExbD
MGIKIMNLPTESDRTPDINVVALIDVLFAILTFFIMTSLTLSRTEGLPVNLPTAATGKSQDQTQIVITVDRRGEISLNRQSIDLTKITPQIRSMLATQPQSLVIINADENVEHGKVVAIMDRVREVPGVKLGISTKRK